MKRNILFLTAVITALNVSIAYSQCSISITSQTNVTCNGGNDGSLTAVETGGTAPFNYVWVKGTTSVSNTFGTSDTFSIVNNLTAGTYTVIMTDAASCTTTATAVTATATITQPALLNAGIISMDTLVSLTLDSSCFGVDDTISSITGASGSLGAYDYLWQRSFDNVNWATAPAPNTNENYIVDDPNITTHFRRQVKVPACNETKFSNAVTMYVIDQVDPAISALDADCEGTKTGAVTTSPNGGFGELEFIWNTGDTISTLQNRYPGIYTVTITDEFGCVGIGTDTINFTHPKPVFSFEDDTVMLAKGFATLSAPTGFTHYLWSNDATDETINCETEGNYWCIVEDSNGCKESDTIYVDLVLGIAESGQSISVRVYPNPVRDVINIQANNNELPSSIVLRDMNGRVLVQETKSNQLNVRDISAGTYLIDVRLKDAGFSKLIIIQ
ncbi:MAG: T9SS type A sorting domain-containing protein [Flavobacteriales bacterium]